MYFMIGQICQGRNVLIKRYEKYMYSAITDDKDSILGLRLVTRKQEAGVTDRSTLDGVHHRLLAALCQLALIIP